MYPFHIEKIYLDEAAEGDGAAQTVLKNLSHVEVEQVGDKKALIKQFLSLPDSIGVGKRHLFLTRFYGRGLKPCPGTSRHICCGYYVVNAITNCPMDCSYCVLQGYLNNPLLTLYTNWEDLLLEIEAFLSDSSRPLPRVGTGELSDSLALDAIFPFSQKLIALFAQQELGILELKTKSAQVDHLLPLDHRGRTVLSWSLSPPHIVAQEERRTASLQDRIDAAEKSQARGYPVGFHFDPIIHYEDWEGGYLETIQTLFKRIDPKRVVWVSLGGFRYPPQLKAIAKERFPETRIFLEELFPGRDAKFRYFKDLRVQMYRQIVEWLREVDPGLFIYLCMESGEVWEKVFGCAPENSLHLNHLFDQRVKAFLK